MSWLRRILASISSFFAGIALLLGGAPPELASIAAASIGLFVEGVVSEERTRDLVLADHTNAARRAQVYEEFGAAIGQTWQAAGILMTYRPRFVGYVHGMALLVRSQRRFEESFFAAMAALSGLLLYGSTETQQSGVEVFRSLGACLREVSGYSRRDLPRLQEALEDASTSLGNKVVAWRASAQADLGMG